MLLTDDPINLKFLAGGRNWVQLASYISISLATYQGLLPRGSTVSITVADPGSTAMDSPSLVASGKYDLGVTTPNWYGNLAVNGIPPFDEPLPLRALAALPHDDQLVFAVRTETGLTSIEDIRDQKYPLKICMPEPALRHPATWVVDEVLAEYGFSVNDILSWGGKLIPTHRKRTRMEAHEAGADEDFDAVFDEAVMTLRWQNIARDHQLTFLPISDRVRKHFEQRGMTPGTLVAGRLPGVKADVPVIDFSGWLLFCREDMPDQMAHDIVASVLEQGPAIEKSFGGPETGLTGPVTASVISKTEPMPLHPGALAYYRELGVL